MDPLSISASVAGLLSICALLASTLQSFTSAHSTAMIASIEIHNFQQVLERAVPLLLGSGPPTASISRSSMIDLDAVILTLTGCVITVQDLEREINRLAKFEAASVLGRMTWALAQSTIDALLRQLQKHKSTLATMLLILSCDSQDEARQGMQKLQKTVEKLVAVNSQILRGLHFIGAGPAFSGRTEAQDDSCSIRGSVRSFISINSDFETTLLRSRLYTRALARANARVRGSSIQGAPRTMGMSVLSGISLSEVSNVSVCALPLFIQQLDNQKPYTPQHGMKADRAFLRAASQGNRMEVLLWLARGANIETRWGNQSPALCESAWRGDAETVRLLLKEGADVNAKTVHGDTALPVAAANGHTAVLELLLNGGANVGAMMGNLRTALHLAAVAGQTECVRVLLNHGAQVECLDIFGFTPVQLAMDGGHTVIIQLLVEHGADAERSEGAMRNPASVLVTRGVDRKTTEFVSASRPSIPVSPESSHYVLQIPLEGNQSPGLEPVLISRGADIERREDNHRTSVSRTSLEEQVRSATMIFPAGVQINSEDPQTPIPQSFASSHGSPDLEQPLHNSPEQYTRNFCMVSLHLQEKTLVS